MQLYTRSEVARQLRISLDTLKRLTSSGQLRACHIGRRVLFSEAAINEFIVASEGESVA